MGMFKPYGTWWNPNQESVTRDQCSYIEFSTDIKEFPTSQYSYIDTWFADEESTIQCHFVYNKILFQYELFICDTSIQPFLLNPNAKGFFVKYDGVTPPDETMSSSDLFLNVTEIKGLDLLNWELVEDFSSAFFCMESLTHVYFSQSQQVSETKELRLNNLVSKTNSVNLRGMFNGCAQLIEIIFPEQLQVNNVSYLFNACNNIEAIYNIDWDVSHLTNFSHTFAWCRYLETDLSHWKLNTSQLLTCDHMFDHYQALIPDHMPDMSNIKLKKIDSIFADCRSLTTIPYLNTWDTSNVTSLSNVFHRCRALEELDLSSWDTTQVTDFTSCFSLCGNLKSITFGSQWSMDNATSIVSFFEECPIEIFFQNDNFILPQLPSQVTSLDFLFSGTTIPSETFTLTLNWDTSNIKSMKSMFAGSKFIPIGLNEWDVSNVEDMSYMFADAQSSNLQLLDLSTWNVGKVKALENTFSNLQRGVPKQIFTITSNTTNLDNVFAYNELNLSHLNVSNWDTSKVITLKAAFQGSRSLPKGIELWNLGNCLDLRYTFAECKNLSQLDLSRWNTEKVSQFMGIFSNNSTYPKGLSNFNFNSAIDIAYMFNGCSNIASLDLSAWRSMPKLINAIGVFANCDGVPQGLEHWNVSNIEDFSHMFANIPTEIELLELTNWNTSHAKHFEGMFSDSAFKVIDLRGWKTDTVLNFNAMFYNCYNLQFIYGLENWNTDSGKTFADIFAQCPKLKELNLSSWDTTNVTYGEIFVGGKVYATIKDFDPNETAGVQETAEEWTMESLGLNNFFGYDENISLARIKVGVNYSFTGSTTNSLIGYAQLPVGTWYDLNKESIVSTPGQKATTYFKDYLKLNRDIYITRKQIVKIADKTRKQLNISQWFNGINDLIEKIKTL